jgi:prevent-host-death family protein
MEIGTYEARTHLSHLLEEVASGKQFTITKHGVPVAVLGPPAANRLEGSEHVVAELKQFRRGITLGGLELRELLEEGRR